MSNRITAIVECGDHPGRLLRTVRSVEEQLSGSPRIVLVTDDTLPGRARPWVDAFCRRKSIVHIYNDAWRPGYVRNSAMQAVEGDFAYFLEAGDVIDRSFQGRTMAWLDANPHHEFVTTGLLTIGPGAARELRVPPELNAAAILSDTELIHSASVLRQTAWVSAGGFDQELEALELWAFWVKVLTQGGSGGVIRDALVVRTRDRQGLYRRDWNAEQRARAIAQVVGRFSERASPADVLVALEERIRRKSRIYGERVTGRDRAVEEIRDLSAKLTSLDSDVTPAPGIDLGDLSRTTSVSRDWGYDRGGPIDRHYIEEFIQLHAADVAGDVLEVQEQDYSVRFGDGRVTKSDVVDIDPSNSRATVISDLRQAANIGDATYDCIILTQTIHVIDDMQAVAGECHRILKPGGVLLATLPAVSRVCVEYGQNGDFWRATEAGARHLFGAHFRHEGLEVRARGNVLVSTAFLYGLGRREIATEDYAADDPYFPLLVTVRAVKSRSPALSRQSHPHTLPAVRPAELSGAAVLLYHRVASVGTDVHRLAVPPDEFRRQMEYISQNYLPLSLGQLAADIKSGNVREGSIVVTFDDGYADNVEAAAPILRRTGVPATFFVTSALRPERGYWWDAIERIFLTPNNALPDSFDLGAVGGEGIRATRTPEDRLATHWILYSLMAQADLQTRNAILDAVAGWSGQSGVLAENRRATASELETLASDPTFEIGAHTVHHLMLPRQTAEVRRNEIAECRRTLESQFGRRITSFAYPFGSYDDASGRAVAEAGLEVGVTCEQSGVPRHADLLALPRLDVAARGDIPFEDWLEHFVGPRQRRRQSKPSRRALVAGWFSYAQSDFTAGDLLACDVVCEWLQEAGMSVDVAVVPPLSGGVDLSQVEPAHYSHAVFVCGPFMPNDHEQQFVHRFRHCRLIGVNLSMPVPLHEWNPFSALIERDSDQRRHPDITLASHEPGVPIAGVCLVEPYEGADTETATLAVDRLLASRRIAAVPIDTRLDVNSTGLRSKAEVESLISRMDVVVTTRLHGLVLAIKHGIPALAIDPESADGRISRQARALGWPVVVATRELDQRQLAASLDYCLTEAARIKARECREQAMPIISRIKIELLAALTSPASPSSPKSPSSPDPAPPSSASREA